MAKITKKKKKTLFFNLKKNKQDTIFKDGVYQVVISAVGKIVQRRWGVATVERG